MNNKIIKLFIQNWENIKGKTYKLKKQVGEGSYHTKKDLDEFTNGDIDWTENIAEYKAALRLRT